MSCSRALCGLCPKVSAKPVETDAHSSILNDTGLVMHRRFVGRADDAAVADGSVREELLQVVPRGGDLGHGLLRPLRHAPVRARVAPRCVKAASLFTEPRSTMLRLGHGLRCAPPRTSAGSSVRSSGVGLPPMIAVGRGGNSRVASSVGGHSVAFDQSTHEIYVKWKHRE